MKARPVAVVIPCRRHEMTLPPCLRALAEHTSHPDWEVVLVLDGGPAPAGLPRLPNLRVLRGRYAGVADALNAGIAAAPGRDIVRLHADVIVETPGWLGELAEASERLPRAGVIGARLVYPDGRIQSDGRSIVTGFGFHPRHRDVRAFQAESAAGALAETDSVPGALAYYRREAFDEIGGLDSRYGPAGFEDDDYCFAARTRGYKVFVQPEVRAVHYTRSCPPTLGPFVPGTEKVILSLVRQFKQTAERLQAARWEAKWGWHPFHPDLNEIRRLYGSTEVCWRIGETMRYRPASETPMVDCCIVTWNSLPFLRRTLESLARTDYPDDRLRVYIANNGSTDGTTGYLDGLKETFRFRLHPVHLPVNTGVAAGLNVAISAGDGELVGRLDDDIILPPDWVRLLVRDLRQRPFAGVAGLKTVFDDERRAVQWAAEQKHPRWFSHGDEPDAGRTDFLSRVPHVAGCCNIYRREAIRRCGLIDVRYAPSQWDDIDHGTMLFQAGYEVLCDGRSHVVHKKTSALDRSASAMASAAGNLQKLLGKWGKDVFEVVDASLLLSREGRSLPPDGDTSSWMARGPSPDQFPRPAVPDPEGEVLLQRLHQNQAPPAAGSELYSVCDDHLALARSARREGDLRAALDIVLTAVNFAPTRPECHLALAEIQRDLGNSAGARLAARRGLHLAPEDAGLARLAGTTSEEIAAREKSLIAAMKAEAGPPSVSSNPGRLKILFVGPFQPRPEATERDYLREFARRLAAAGAEVAIQDRPQPNPAGFDLVHFWGSSLPHQTVAQVKAVRLLAPGLPAVLTPFYHDAAEARWCGRAISSLIGRSSQAVWEKGLAELAAGAFSIAGDPRPERVAIAALENDLSAMQRALFALVDHVFTFNAVEEADIRKHAGWAGALSRVPTGIDTDRMAAASAGPFVAKFGLRDFFLFIGPVDPVQNPMMMLSALQGGGIPAVVIGPEASAPYAKACRRFAPPGSLFLETLGDDLLDSACRAARVLVVPAWSEASSPAAIRGGLAGCSLAMSEDAAERDSLGPSARLFDPRRIAGVRAALQQAWAAHPARIAERQALAGRLAAVHGWRAVTERAIGFYRSMLAPRAESVAA